MKRYIHRKGTSARKALRFLMQHPLGTKLLTREVLKATGLHDDTFASCMRACINHGVVERVDHSPRRKYWRLLVSLPELLDEEDEEPELPRNGELYRLGRNVPGEELCRVWGVGAKEVA